MAVNGAEHRKGRLRAETLAWFALAGVVVYVGIDVLLRLLRPRYSLIYNAESDYGRGPWYWVMDLNFLLRCALSLALPSPALCRRLSGRLPAFVPDSTCSSCGRCVRVCLPSSPTMSRDSA